MNRRKLLRMLGMTTLGGVAPIPSFLSPQLFRDSDVATASAAQKYKFLQIFLMGGWDSALAGDPVLGPKANDHYSPVYWDETNSQFPGKPIAVSAENGVFVGPGLAPAVEAFKSVPTAWINGMFVEVTSHELAQAYLLSGTLSLSRSRVYPSRSFSGFRSDFSPSVRR